MGYANWNLRCWYIIHCNGIDNSINLWTLVISYDQSFKTNVNQHEIGLLLNFLLICVLFSLYVLFRSMCSDLVYCILFPQLLMVVHFKHHCNTYGSLSAYIVAFVVRLSGGEAIIGLPALIHFPGYDEETQRQLFPFRTMAMIMSLVTLVGVSAYTKWAFESGRLAPQYDYFRCVVNIPDDAIRVGDPSEVGEQVEFN